MLLSLVLSSSFATTTCSVRDLTDSTDMMRRAADIRGSSGTKSPVTWQIPNPEFDPDNPTTYRVTTNDASDLTVIVRHAETTSENGIVDVVWIEESLIITVSGLVQGDHSCGILHPMAEHILEKLDRTPGR